MVVMVVGSKEEREKEKERSEVGSGDGGLAGHRRDEGEFET